MNRILLILLLVAANSSVLANFYVIGDQDTTSSTSADGACLLKAQQSKSKMEYELAVSDGGYGGVNIHCIVFGTIAGYPVRNSYKVTYQGCASGTTLDDQKTSCIPDTSLCEKHKGTVLHDQRASYCTSNGKPKYYIGQCDVLASDGGVIIAPPSENPSMGYFGDWVITGLPKSACTPEKPEEPDPEKPDENNCPEGSTWSGSTCVPNGSGEGDGDGGDGGDDNGGNNGGSTGGDGGSTGGGSTGGDGGSTGGGSTGGRPGGGDGDGDGGNGDGGNGNGNGGNGSGGDCDPSVEECGEGNGSSVNGGSCDQPISCKGDVIQCAQLEKQWEIKCAAEELYKKDADINRQLDQLVKKNSNPISGFGGEAINETNIADLITEGSGWLPRSCPAPMTVTVAGTTLEFPFTKTCELASSLSGLIVALFAFLGIRVFGRQG